MGPMATEITDVTSVFSTVCSGAFPMFHGLNMRYFDFIAITSFKNGEVKTY